MIRNIALGICAVLIFVTFVQAHGGGAHLMGTITAVDAKSVTIKDKDGKAIVVNLDKATKFVREKKAASTGDLKVGERVVIHAKMDEKTKAYTAEEVDLGAAAAATTAKKKQ